MRQMMRRAGSDSTGGAMGVLRFDEEELTQQLERLPPPFRTAFAAAVAERLLPAYASFAHQTGQGDPTELAAILQRLWLNLEGSQTSAEQDHNIALCMSSVPQESSGTWVPEQAYAEDAAAALAYALRSRKDGQAQEAAWAARRAYEALDHFIVEQEGIDTNEAGAETRVLSHPLVQAELLRQQRDLGELAANQQNLTRIADQIRERAKAESAYVFKSKPH
jgi:uncharacterized protein YjaG (DUF416 family)